MPWVLDTNLLVSALIWRGTPRRLLEQGFAAGAILRKVESPPLSAPVCRDPDDDAVLACALAAQAGLIVSSDKDWLALERFQRIPIVSAAQALAKLSSVS